ncbi:caspase family protein [Streptomyces gardneri]|nr:caspase family protein [Streptomyces gardneri]
MKLSDPARSRAVIVGTSHQAEGTGYTSLPAVARNVARMSELFRDPAVWGLPQPHCVELLNASRDEVFTTLGKTMEDATDTVVFHFAGHGARHLTTNEFYLCLPGARKNGIPEHGRRHRRDRRDRQTGGNARNRGPRLLRRDVHLHGAPRRAVHRVHRAADLGIRRRDSQR